MYVLVRDSMREEPDASSQAPDRPCTHSSRRVIRLRWPYTEAGIMRARFVTEHGRQFDVSPLYQTEGGWAFTICSDCAQRAMTALAVFLVLPA